MVRTTLVCRQRQLSLVLCLALLSGLAPIAQAQDEGTAIRIEFADSVAVQEFIALDGAYQQMLSERPGRLLDVLVTEPQLQALSVAGYSYTELQRYEWDHRQPADGKSATGLPAFTNYTFASVQADLNGLAASYPGLAALSVLTQTQDGYPLYLLKVSDNVGTSEDEPRLYLQAEHHGGETIGTDVCLAILHELLDNYGIDPQLTAWVDNYEIFVVPLANPDGWMMNENGVTSGWRKNTRDNNANGSFNPGADGVDLNRNMFFNWGMAGSGNMGSSTYYGPSALSEPEDVAIAALAAQQRFSLALTFHMSGEVIIMPWTWGGKKTPDNATYTSIGSALGGAIPRLGAGNYGSYVASDTGGYLDDHLYGLQGTLCYTVEVSSSNTTASINQAVANNVLGVRYILGRLAGGQITGLTTNAKTGAPMEAQIEIRQIDTSSLADRMSDEAFGRFRWMLKDGSYQLDVSSTQGFASQSVVGLVVNGVAGPTVQNVALVPLESWIDGAPTLGNGLTLELDGVAGDDYFQFIGFGTASIVFPGYGGLLQVDPLTLTILASGVLGPSGSNTIPVAVPANPALVGLLVSYQSLTGADLVGNNGHFTNLATMTLR